MKDDVQLPVRIVLNLKAYAKKAGASLERISGAWEPPFWSSLGTRL